MFLVGLDLGQASDPSAVAVLEQTWLPDPFAPKEKVNHYACRHLERIKLGTPLHGPPWRAQRSFTDGDAACLTEA